MATAYIVDAVRTAGGKREVAVGVVVQRRRLRRKLQAAGDLLDELLAAFAGQKGDEIAEIDKLCRNHGVASERRLRP